MKDKRVYETLITALGQMGTEAKKYQDKKLWKEITLPQTYEELLKGLSKDELLEISRHYGLRNISTLKKNDLVEYLVAQLPCQLLGELYLMDEQRYLFLKQFVSEDDKVFRIVQADDYDNKLAFYWRKTGLIFSGCVQGQKVLFMPSELQDAFQAFDNVALQNKLGQNTEWLSLTYGMLYFYGVMGYMKILTKLEELTGVQPDYQEFHTILLCAEEFYGAPKLDSYGYMAHQNVPDIDALRKEHKERAEVNYYRFSKSKLLKAGKPNYFDDNPAFQRLSNFLSDHYKMTKKEANDLTVECQHIVNQFNKPSAIFDFLKTKIEFPNYELVQRLGDVVIYFWNNTRQWSLKGHSPVEISTEVNPGPSSLQENLQIPFNRNLPFAAPVARPAPSGQTIGKTDSKVGRNDPCPCGSGKKFKQCCGRL